MSFDIASRPSFLGQNQSGHSLYRSATGGLGKAMPPRISLNGDKFTLIEADDQPNPLIPATLTIDVIVVGANENPSRIYYAKYEPGMHTPPICFSDNGVGPSSQAAQPQHVVCSTCPRAKWDQPGFTPGSLVPACKMQKKIAVVDGRNGNVYALAIPPKSTKAWTNYCRLLDTHHTELFQLVTRIGWSKDNDKTLTFEPSDWFSEEWMSKVEALLDSHEVREAVNAGDTPWTGSGVTTLPEPPQQQAPPVQPPVRLSSPPAQFYPDGIVPMSAPPTETPKTRGRPRGQANVQTVGPSAASPAPATQSDFIQGPPITAGFSAPPSASNADMEAILARALGGPQAGKPFG